MLAHETGHSETTGLTNQSQPPRNASDTIFKAAIPSALKEVLLPLHLRSTNDDSRFWGHLPNHYCD